MGVSTGLSLHSSPVIVQLQVSFDIGRNRHQAGQVAQAWFRDGWVMLGGELRVALDDCRVRESTGDERLFPLGVHAGLVVSDSSNLACQAWDAAYSDATWTRFLADLEKLPDALFSASAMVPAYVPGGSPLSGTRYETPFYMEMNMDRFHGVDGHIVRLTFTTRHEFLCRTIEREKAAIRYFMSIVDAYDMDYGEFGFGHGGPVTSVESVLGRDGLREAREVLRGYSWITVVSTEIAERLGGIERLSKCGAFYEVSRLQSGGLWLRATERFDDYGQKAAEAVFAVLASVLPRGAIASTFRQHNDVYPA